MLRFLGAPQRGLHLYVSIVKYAICKTSWITRFGANRRCSTRVIRCL